MFFTINFNMSLEFICLLLVYELRKKNKCYKVSMLLFTEKIVIKSSIYEFVRKDIRFLRFQQKVDSNLPEQIIGLFLRL